MEEIAKNRYKYKKFEIEIKNEKTFVITKYNGIVKSSFSNTYTQSMKWTELKPILEYAKEKLDILQKEIICQNIIYYKRILLCFLKSLINPIIYLKNKINDFNWYIFVPQLPLIIYYYRVKYLCFHKSPYSNSYYNTNKKDWDTNPLNHIRISDHWNFEDRYKDFIHCNTDVYLKKGWAVAKWDGTKYVILHKL